MEYKTTHAVVAKEKETPLFEQQFCNEEPYQTCMYLFAATNLLIRSENICKTSIFK